MQASICRLAIAGIGVALHCTEPALLSALQTRYLPYQSEESVFDIQIERTTTVLPTGKPEAEIDEQNGLIVLRATSYVGTIDLGAHSAHLRLSTPAGFEEVEYVLRVVYALLVFRAGGILFHAAGIVRDGICYLFFGHSGSGKTTVARLSAEDLVLNDDLVVLMPEDQGWVAHATPFYNPTQIPPTGPQAASIKSLLRLVQDTTVYLEPIGTARAMAEVLASVPIVPVIESLNRLLIPRIRALLNAIPVLRLHFLPDSTFWPIVLVEHSHHVTRVGT